MTKPSRTHNLLCLVSALALASPATAAMSLRYVKSASLPEAMIIRDVRWASASEVYVTAGRKGAFRIPVDSPSHLTSVLPGSDRGGFPLSGRIAVGQRNLMVAAPLGAYGWTLLDGTPQKIRYKTLLTVMD